MVCRLLWRVIKVECFHTKEPTDWVCSNSWHVQLITSPDSKKKNQWTTGYFKTIDNTLQLPNICLRCSLSELAFHHYNFFNLSKLCISFWKYKISFQLRQLLDEKSYFIHHTYFCSNVCLLKRPPKLKVFYLNSNNLSAKVTDFPKSWRTGRRNVRKNPV